VEFWSTVLPKVVSMVLSWIDHGNLRNRVYELQERMEILEVALDDIQRINKDPLIDKIVKNTLKK
jgi:hypothetical protein